MVFDLFGGFFSNLFKVLFGGGSGSQVKLSEPEKVAHCQKRVNDAVVAQKDGA